MAREWCVRWRAPRGTKRSVEVVGEAGVERPNNIHTGVRACISEHGRPAARVGEQLLWYDIGFVDVSSGLQHVDHQERCITESEGDTHLL